MHINSHFIAKTGQYKKQLNAEQATRSGLQFVASSARNVKPLFNKALSLLRNKSVEKPVDAAHCLTIEHNKFSDRKVRSHRELREAQKQHVQPFIATKPEDLKNLKGRFSLIKYIQQPETGKAIFVGSHSANSNKAQKAKDDILLSHALAANATDNEDEVLNGVLQEGRAALIFTGENSSIYINPKEDGSFSLKYAENGKIRNVRLKLPQVGPEKTKEVARQELKKALASRQGLMVMEGNKGVINGGRIKFEEEEMVLLTNTTGHYQTQDKAAAKFARQSIEKQIGHTFSDENYSDDGLSPMAYRAAQLAAKLRGKSKKQVPLPKE